MSIPKMTREFRQMEFTGPGTPGGLVIQDSPIKPLKDGEVLVKIHAVSLQGSFIFPTTQGIVPCSDCAGEVISVSESVKNFQLGDRVSANFNIEHIYGSLASEDQKANALGGKIDGCLTEYRAFPAYSLVHIPKHLSYEEASTLPCATLTAYVCLFGPVPLKGGDVVLTQGSGGVSVSALQIARANGATVIATTSSNEKGKILSALGADHVINYKENTLWEAEVLKLTNGRGVDHVVEVGGAATIMQTIACTRFGGSIHTVGFIGSQKGDADVASLLRGLLSKCIHLRGNLVGSRVQYEALNRLVSATGLKPVIDRVFAFDEYPQALMYLETQKHVGKIVVKMSKDD